MRAPLLASLVLLLSSPSSGGGAGADAEAACTAEQPLAPPRPAVLHGSSLPWAWTADELTHAIEYLQAVQEAQLQGCTPVEPPSDHIRRHLQTQRRRRAAAYLDEVGRVLREVEARLRRQQEAPTAQQQAGFDLQLKTAMQSLVAAAELAGGEPAAGTLLQLPWLQTLALTIDVLIAIGEWRNSG